jgi:hypothetical protein
VPADQSGPVAPKASVDAPRAAGGPKPPPRPARPAAVPGDVRGAVVEAFPDVPTRAEPPAVVPRARETGRPGELPEPIDGGGDASAEQAPLVSPPPTLRRGRPVRRGRRVKRVVRRIDLWSVLKLALLVYTCLYGAVLATLAALWGLLYSSGSVERLQSFLADVGLDNFTFYGDQMFRAAAAIGAVGVLAGTVITVLATALINVISEMTGGIRLVVIEEDVER